MKRNGKVGQEGVGKVRWDRKFKVNRVGYGGVDDREYSVSIERHTQKKIEIYLGKSKGTNAIAV